ncbi:class I SAM-dependent methyltransferase [Gordonia sp. X0973]|uniref:class I SAM-dependent methyltransferase n=1 Tax=Gordonia sp. X0973 TaxID=2742602 RepID=UPI000F53EBF7|nr:class I SAM-dependent methyltransferase [Gordonia sp. X0973]QKT06003.1 class I SAM-dependent methyltransferase [Gordonia sp. X0973]
MTAELPSHLDRQRADSFGSRALAYDALRPRYPSELVGYLAAAPGIRVLDVGSGTGILARQLAEAGADVLAVEPDPRMARVARDHGITVEESTFEEWEDAGRRFDLVTFGQSFHWVDPQRALPKVRTILAPGGALILTWNRVKPIRPTTEALTAINSTVFPGNRTDMVAGAERIRDQIVDAGFAI